MIYHILNTTSTYPARFVDFLVKYRQAFDLDRHFFIFTGTNLSRFSSLSSVRYDVSPHLHPGLFRYFLRSKTGDRFIIHGLQDPRLYLILSCETYARRSVWSIWGGDLYFGLQPQTSFKYKLYEALRKKAIRCLGGIVCVVPGDIALAQKKYGHTGKTFHAAYPTTLVCSSDLPASSKKTLFIQVGNSADDSNRHIEVFRMLSRYASEDIRIYCPLSYGQSWGGKKNEYVKKVVEQGYMLFGKKFYPLLDFMPPEEYATYLASLDVLVFFHDRQQGLGNLFPMLMMGKKVFLKSTTTTYRYLHDLGVVIYDSFEIPSLDFITFASCREEDKQKNKNIISHELAEENLVRQWLQVCNAEL